MKQQIFFSRTLNKGYQVSLTQTLTSPKVSVLIIDCGVAINASYFASN